MTRDQAVRKLNMLPIGASCGFEPWLIDALVSLGMLKLDEPKSAPHDKIKALAKELSNFASGCTCFDCLTRTLDRHGLRIVEK